MKTEPDPLNHPLGGSSPQTSGGKGAASGERLGFLGAQYHWVIVVLGLFNVLGSIGFARFGYPLILPPMKENLALTHTQMGLLGSGNFVGYLIASLLGGYWASKYGSRRVILLSFILVAGCMILTGLSRGFLFALSMRFLTGLGSGGAYIPMIGLCMGWFPPKQRGMASGLMISGSGFGLILTGWIIPAVMTSYGREVGWRYCWMILGLFIFLFWAFSLFLLREAPQEKTSSAPSSPPWSMVYRNPVLWHLALIYFTSGFSLSMYMTFFGAHTARAGHLPPGTIGRIWSLMGFLSVFSGLVWGWASDRWGRRYALLMVFALHGISFSIFAGAKQAWAFYLSACILGTAAWAIATILSATAADYVGPQLAPAAIGFITLVFGIGQVISPFVAGQIADRFGSFSAAYVLAASVTFIGWLRCLSLRPKSA